MKVDPLCTVESCDHYLHARGMCFMHYQRYRKFGTFEGSGITHRPKQNYGKAEGKCKNGHPWSEKNTYVDPSGYLRCRVCAKNCVENYLAKNGAKGWI